jgi:hypothetical protein
MSFEGRNSDLKAGMTGERAIDIVVEVDDQLELRRQLRVDGLPRFGSGSLLLAESVRW